MSEKIENNEMAEQKQNTEVEVQQKFREFQPAVDIEETKDDYVVCVDMPGLTPDQIQVGLDKEILTIEAKAEFEGFAPRLYHRQFRVTRGLDPAKCRADYKLGVLTLRLAKPSTEKPHQIKISCDE